MALAKKLFDLYYTTEVVPFVEKYAYTRSEKKNYYGNNITYIGLFVDTERGMKSCYKNGRTDLLFGEYFVKIPLEFLKNEKGPRDDTIMLCRFIVTEKIKEGSLSVREITDYTYRQTYPKFYNILKAEELSDLLVNRYAVDKCLPLNIEKRIKIFNEQRDIAPSCRCCQRRFAGDVDKIELVERAKSNKEIITEAHKNHNEMIFDTYTVDGCHHCVAEFRGDDCSICGRDMYNGNVCTWRVSLAYCSCRKNVNLLWSWDNNKVDWINDISLYSKIPVGNGIGPDKLDMY